MSSFIINPHIFAAGDDIIDLAIGDTTIVEDVSAPYLAVTKLAATSAVAVYVGATASQLRATVLTISGDEITVTGSTYVVYSSGNNILDVQVAALTSTLAIFVIRDNQSYYQSRCLSVSGTVVSAGATCTVLSGVSYTCIKLVAMNSTTAICTLATNTIGYPVCLSVSGTTITATTGSSFTCNAYHDLIKLSSSLAFMSLDTGSMTLKGVCLSLSGTTITAGSYTTLAASYGTTGTISASALNSEYALVSRRINGSSAEGFFLVSISGTTVTLEDTKTDSTTTPYDAGSRVACTFNETHVGVFFTDTDYDGFCSLIMRDGATISIVETTEFITNGLYTYINQTSVSELDTNKAVFIYRDMNNTYRPTACVITV